MMPPITDGLFLQIHLSQGQHKLNKRSILYLQFISIYLYLFLCPNRTTAEVSEYYEYCPQLLCVKSGDDLSRLKMPLQLQTAAASKCLAQHNTAIVSTEGIRVQI